MLPQSGVGGLRALVGFLLTMAIMSWSSPPSSTTATIFGFRSLKSSAAACYAKDIARIVIDGMIGGGSRLRIDSSLRMVASRLNINLVGSTRRRPAVHGNIPAKMGCK